MPWKNPFVNADNYQRTVLFLLALTMVSLAFSVRIVNSLSLIFLVVVTLAHPHRLTFFRKAFSNPYFIFCLFLYLIKISGIFYTDYFDESWKQVTGKGILLAIPFFFCANPFLSESSLRKLMVFFSVSLVIVSLACIVYAVHSYNQQHDSSVFFYHQLVKPFKHHAVLFSFYLFFCIVYWVERGLRSKEAKKIRTIVLALIIYFYLFIFLLSSKLVIIIALVYLLYAVTSAIVKNRMRYGVIVGGLLLITAISAVLLTNNPIRSRFSDALRGNSFLFKQEKFSPDVYFNGVQLRLLIWRFTYEILQEKNAWLIGVSTGDAQPELNRKFADANVYLGNGENDKLGYRAFNCHNVFLQTILESGLIGLFFLLAIISTFLIQAFIRQSQFAIIFFLSMLAFCFTESVLSSQYTILLFMFFPLLSLNIQKNKD